MLLHHHLPLLSSVLTPSRIHIIRYKINPHSSTPTPVFAKPKKKALTLYRSSTSSKRTQITEDRTGPVGASEEECFQVVSAIKSMHNDIVILETPESRLLLLDRTHNVHSIFYKEKQGYWTDSYWDEFAALPPIIPPGPITIYGLGGGTAAHILLDSYPHLEIEGWEIDGVLVDKARDYLGLKELESVNAQGGVLSVFVGDALNVSNSEYGRYAGIIVDLFSNGKVLDEMKEKEFWVGIKKRLHPGGRVMVNCGGAENVTVVEGEDEWVANLTIQAIWEVFEGELCWKKMPKMEGANYMAVTGEMPDLGEWEVLVPEELKAKVWGWMPFPNVPMQ